MKKRILSLLMVLVLGCVSVTACGGEEKTKKETVTKSIDEAKKLTSYTDVIDVLYYSKINNDLDAFLSMFKYMEALMRSTVTENDHFAGIKDTYKETYGDDIAFTYEVTEYEKASAEDTQSYKETVELFGGIAEFTEAFNLKAVVTVKGSKSKADLDLDIAVAQVNGVWQIVNFGGSLLQ